VELFQQHIVFYLKNHYAQYQPINFPYPLLENHPNIAYSAKFYQKAKIYLHGKV